MVQLNVRRRASRVRPYVVRPAPPGPPVPTEREADSALLTRVLRGLRALPEPACAGRGSLLELLDAQAAVTREIPVVPPQGGAR